MGNEFEIGQVHAPRNIVFGNVNVFNSVKEDVKTDEKGNTIHCVWLCDAEEGVYVEYPTQSSERFDTYIAREVETGDFNFIKKSTYKSGKTKKDGIQYKFEAVNDYPTIFVEKTNDTFGPLYQGKVNGVNGIKYTGSKVDADVVTFYNTKSGDVYMDNDNKADGVNVGVDCGKIKPHMVKFVDGMSGFSGYVKGEGYFNDYKKIF